jgi:thiamine biosynthesis lipoprotein
MTKSLARLFGVLTTLTVGAVVATAPIAYASGSESSRGEVVMGTVLRVTVVAATDSLAIAATSRAIALARHWDDVLTTWRPEGELARLNRRAGLGPTEISVDLATALNTMTSLSRLTDGAFDPAVGALVRRYSQTQEEQPEFSRAEFGEVLRVSGTQAELADGVELDAGGIGKGIALDAIAAELRRDVGVTGAYLDFGGSSQLAFGETTAGGPWVIALAGASPGEIHGTLPLVGAASTSRSRSVGDETGPIVDPATGRVTAAGRFSTCFGTTATETEAWSTALIVRGRSAIPAAEDRRIHVLYEDGKGPAFLSSSLARDVYPLERASDQRADKYVSTEAKNINK